MALRHVAYKLLKKASKPHLDITRLLYETALDESEKSAMKASLKLLLRVQELEDTACEDYRD